MNLIRRVIAILLDPAAEWARIEQEQGDPIYLLCSYVAILALIPAICGFVGNYFIGIAPPNGLSRAPLFDGVFGAIFGYLETFAAMALLALGIQLAAPGFGGQRNFANALRLAVYFYTPVWLAGVFLLLPGLRFLTLTGCYGAYVLMFGVSRMTKTPAERSLGFTALIVAGAFVLALIASAVRHGLFPESAGI